MRVLLSLPLFCSLLSATVQPVRLECEARVNPLGVDAARPRLSWVLESAEKGQRQTAYRILVASKPELLQAGQGDLWDSGEVVSDETLSIPYSGKALASNQRCFWRVRTRDRAEVWTTSAATAEWTMGLLKPEDWHAGWIMVPGGALVPGPLPLFRKEFEVAKPLRRALLHVAGLGQHEVTFNGAPASDHLFAPAWSDYRKRIYYETLDVTALLRQGRNAAGVLLGNGMYNVPGGRYAKFTASFGPPKLRFQMDLEYADGSRETVGSDGSWKTAPGPITFNCIYGGEDYDARLEKSGWDRPGYDDSKWQAASGTEAPGGVMAAQFSPPVLVQKRYQDGQREADPAGRLPLRPGDELRGPAEDSGARRGGPEDPAHARRISGRAGPSEPAGYGLAGLVRVHAQGLRVWRRGRPGSRTPVSATCK